MLNKHSVLLFSLCLSTMIFTSCKSIRSETGGHEKILTPMVSDNGKIAEPDARPYCIGSYLKVKGKPSIWRREIGNYELSITWEKVGKEKTVNNRSFQSYRKVKHYKILLADVEYAYCRQVLDIDMLTGKPVCMPPVLKKTWDMKNVKVIKTLDVNTSEMKTIELNNRGVDNHGVVH